jgi:hypothetical protein
MPLEGPRDMPLPSEYNQAFPDILESDYVEISRELECPQRLTLCNGDKHGALPVKGWIFGPAYRLCVPMVVQKGSIRVLVIFIVDPCSPATYLRADTLRALCDHHDTEAVTEYTTAKVNGTTTQVYLARDGFANVDVLGSDYLRSQSVKVVADYRNLTVSIDAATR